MGRVVATHVHLLLLVVVVVPRTCSYRDSRGRNVGYCVLDRFRSVPVPRPHSPEQPSGHVVHWLAAMARLNVGTFNIGASSDLMYAGPTRKTFVDKLRADVHMLMEANPCSMRVVLHYFSFVA